MAQRIEPLRFEGSPEAARTDLLRVVGEMRGARIVSAEPDYLHFEFTTLIMRFVDDLEFSIARNGVIHVRSASRVGHSDFGTNRKRVEAVRETFGGGR